jgi:hypothetical protein
VLGSGGCHWNRSSQRFPVNSDQVASRHHTIVLHAVRKLQRLRREDESIDALIEVLTAAMREEAGQTPVQSSPALWPSELIETITARVLDRVAEVRQESTALVLRSTLARAESL